MSILVTGGAGYIGSHTCIELLEAGYQVVVVDNLCNSSKKSLERVQEITGKELTFYQDDLLDSEALDAIFQRESIDAVIHFAGLKAVGESVQKPLEYYHNNLTGTFLLLEKMKKYQVKNFVFSSSATVYGSPKSVPIREDFPLHVTNPYGRTKLILEEVLTDVHTADPAFNVILLRYFNPIGAHRSGRIGENPKGIPNNLLPYVAQVAIGKLKCLGVFGNDYDTPDGTGVRDYIHVVDLARGHVKAVQKLAAREGVSIYNLGTGTACWMWFMPLKRPAAMRSPMRLSLDGQEISRLVTVIPAKPEKSWAGKRRMGLKKCVRIPGDGRHRIPMDTANNVTPGRQNALIYTGF